MAAQNTREACADVRNAEYAAIRTSKAPLRRLRFAADEHSAMKGGKCEHYDEDDVRRSTGVHHIGGHGKVLDCLLH